jgi:hypothetical protein
MTSTQERPGRDPLSSIKQDLNVLLNINTEMKNEEQKIKWLLIKSTFKKVKAVVTTLFNG